MSRYRRLYVPVGTYFFTVTLADRSATTLVDEIGLLRTVYASVHQEHPIKCDAMVILPDHIHAVWTLPPNDADFSIRWKKIKGRFSQHCHATGTPVICRPTSIIVGGTRSNTVWSINQKIGPIRHSVGWGRHRSG